MTINQWSWIEKDPKIYQHMELVSIKSDQVADLPILETAIRQVAANDEWDFILYQFFFSDSDRIDVIFINLYHNRSIFRDLEGSCTDDSGLFIFSHEARGDFDVILHHMGRLLHNLNLFFFLSWA